MKKLLLALAIFGTIVSKAQIYHPLISDSVLWKSDGYGFGGHYYSSYKTIKDTTIGAHTYRKIVGAPDGQSPHYIREDSVNRKIYSLVENNDQILYDFSLNLGDSLLLHWNDGFYGPCSFNGYYTVDSVSTTNTLAGPRKFMRLNKGGYSYLLWLEGVGALNEFINYTYTYCDLLDCGVSVNVYCQVRDGVNTYEEGPLYSCDSGQLYDCSGQVSHVRHDSDYVFSVHINGIGPYTYRWECYGQDTGGTYHLIDSSFYPNAHFVLPLNIHYIINVHAIDTLGCNTFSGANIYDTTASPTSNCNAFFWIYPNTNPGDYTAVDLSTGSNLSYNWDFGDGGTSTMQLPTHQYTSAGRYTVCLTVNDGAGCTSTYCDSSFYDYKFGGGPMLSLSVVDHYTSITENEIEKQIAVYPNPAKDRLYINSAQAASLLVYDGTGKLISVPVQKTAEGFSVNTGNLTPGIYCVLLKWNNGIGVSKRFVKE